MGRAIDADALMKALYHRAFETDGDTMWQSGCWVRYRAIEQTVKEQPTIEPCEDDGEKTCRTCHLWEDGEINIACPWGSNYEHYEDDYCSLWEKQN